MRNTFFKNFNQRFAPGRAVVFLSALIALSGCKDDRLLGLEVQPEGSLDPLQSIDTFTIHSQTIAGEPQRSSQYRNYVGILDNDIFGRSESVLYLNFQLESENIALENDPSAYEVDSVIFTLYPRSVYGNGATPLILEAYVLDEPIRLDSNYPSNSSFRLDDDPVGITQIQFASNEAISNAVSDADYNGVRWRLDKGLGSFLLNGHGIAYYDTPQFREYFNGMAIKANHTSLPEGGAIYDFAFLAGISGLTVYYHPKTDPDSTETINYELTSNTVRINEFINDYTGSSVEQALNSSEIQQEAVFVQGMSGVKTRIDVPALDEFGLQNDIAISKAELTVEIDPSLQPDGLSVAPTLFLLDFEIESSSGDTIETLNLDFAYSTNRHGGDYDEETNTYTFDLTRQVQKILEESQLGDNINLGWTLHAQVPVLNENQVYQTVLQGSPNIVFKIYYTDLSN